MTSQRRQFGLTRATALVVGNVVGTSIFLTPTLLAAYGSVGLLGWAVTTVGAILLSIVFSRLSKRHPQTGGPYAYSRHAFGDFIGFQMAWCYWIANWVSNAAVAVAFVNFMGYFAPAITQEPTLAFLASASCMWVLTLINVRSVKASSNLQVLVTVLKMLPLIAVSLWGIQHFEVSNLNPLLLKSDTSVWSAINATATLTLFSYFGIESATLPAQNVIKPERTIPRATILGTLIAAVLYLWPTAVVMSVLTPAATAASTSPFADAGRILFGEWAVPVLAGFAALSCFGTLNGWILLQGQIPMAAAEDGLFPVIFKKTNRQGIPVFGLIFSSLLATVILGLNYEAGLIKQFEFIITLTTFAFLLPYIYSAAAELLYLMRHKNEGSAFAWARSLLITALGMMYALWCVWGAGQEIVFLGTFFVLTSVPIYTWMRSRRSI
ncbi:MAG: amino acid permease [Holosporales bacterium]